MHQNNSITTNPNGYFNLKRTFKFLLLTQLVRFIFFHYEVQNGIYFSFIYLFYFFLFLLDIYILSHIFLVFSFSQFRIDGVSDTSRKYDLCDIYALFMPFEILAYTNSSLQVGNFAIYSTIRSSIFQ